MTATAVQGLSGEQFQAMNTLVRLGDYVTPIAIRAIVELRVPDLLFHGPRSAEELAHESGAHAPTLYRVLRSLTAHQIVHEEDDHRFSLTEISDLLREEHPYSMRGMYRLSPADIHAVAEFEYGVRNEESSFEHVHGMSFWEYDARHPEHNERYEDNMASMADNEIQAVLTAFDWSPVRTFVDRGGGTGQFIAGILNAHPDMRGAMIDLPHVVGRAEPTLTEAGLRDRCDVVAGDFFESVPSGGDAYLLKRVFYDFTDEECITILRNVRRAMNPDASVLMLDGMVRSDNRFDFGKLHDLYVLAMGQGRCRTRAELDHICAEADLRVRRVIPTGAFPLLVATAR